MKELVKKVIARVLGGHLVYAFPARRICNISAKQAEQIITEYSPDRGKSSLCNHMWVQPECDLTMIIPVYNVEKYLNKCLDSIANQKTKYSYHVIAVNDESTDSSKEILEQYCNYDWFSFVDQRNGGSAKARNVGLKSVKGRYIMFVDADDFLTENAVESLLNAAYEMNADIVQGAYYDTDEVGQKHTMAKRYTRRDGVTPNGVLAGMPWGKVYKAELFKNVQFPENYLHQDTIITSIITHLAKNIATIPDAVYFYRQNSAGITSTSRVRPKGLDAYWVHKRVVLDRSEMGMMTDSAFYEHLLRMAALCYRRTEKQPEKVKIALMILWKDLLEQERKEEFSLKPKYQRFEKAILNSEYGRYSVLSKFCI